MVMVAARAGSPWWTRCLNWLRTRLMGAANANSGYQVSRRLVWQDFNERWKTSCRILRRSSSTTVRLCRRLWRSPSGRQGIFFCIDTWLETAFKTTEDLVRCLCQALKGEASLLFRLLRDGYITVTVYQFSPVTVTADVEGGGEDTSGKSYGFA